MRNTGGLFCCVHMDEYKMTSVHVRTVLALDAVVAIGACATFPILAATVVLAENVSTHVIA